MLSQPLCLAPILYYTCIKYRNKKTSLIKIFVLRSLLVWDASAKQAVGLLSGNRFQLGDFDECLQVSKPINAQYCLVDIKLNVPSEYSYTDPFARVYDPLLSAWHKIYVSITLVFTKKI